MIRAIHHLLVSPTQADYDELVRFFEALGMARGESWGAAAPGVRQARSRGSKFQAADAGVEIGTGEGFPDAGLIAEVDNADIVYEQVKRLGCVIAREIADCDWGARMFALELPGGHGRLAVFSYKEDRRHPKLEGSLQAAGLHFAAVVSRFNSFITERLLAGALDTLRLAGARNEDVEIVRVPGAFELPGAARLLAQTGRFDALICLGCLLRGETYHYEAIATEATRGIGQVTQETGVPIGFGLLTCDTLEQAIDRAGLKAGNKGCDAAAAAIEMANLRKAARKPE
jgi:6,7-dimethyl-8-ribityllumazine synthase